MLYSTHTSQKPGVDDPERGIIALCLHVDPQGVPSTTCLQFLSRVTLQSRFDFTQNCIIFSGINSGFFGPLNCTFFVFLFAFLDGTFYIHRFCNAGPNGNIFYISN